MTVRFYAWGARCFWNARQLTRRTESPLPGCRQDGGGGRGRRFALRRTRDLIRADAEGRVEFELNRSPDRCDTRIARACGTNVIVVRQVRERLGAYPTRPV
jgi:hypothetical protein